MLETSVSFFSVLLALATLASLIKWNNWWIRIFDFPRLQIAVLQIMTIGVSVLIYNFQSTWHFIFTFSLSICLGYQAYKIYPYTFLARKQVKKYSGNDSSMAISIMISNVLMPNQKSKELIQVIRSTQPQLLLTLESDKWWENQLKELEGDYPYSVKMPLDNLYGMHLYSKLELVDYQVNYLVQENIPSIEGHIKLLSGDLVRIYCIHPKPPAPGESNTSTPRDAEILLVGRKLSKQNEPTLVFGDLNDVAWSNTTRLFQQISGLLDPRIGRGFFSTFHARYPPLRWPLDHVFHSPCFELIQYKRLPDIGSDHFPIYTKLYLQKNRGYKQEIPQADVEEKQEANEKIQEGEPIKEQVKSSALFQTRIDIP